MGQGEMQGLRVRTAHVTADTIEVDDDARERCALALRQQSADVAGLCVALVPAALRQREGLFRVSRPGCDLDAHRRAPRRSSRRYTSH